MKDPVVCNSKVFYNGEFTAERAASIAEHKWGEEMIAYKCGTHWHIAHKHPHQRNQYPRREKRDWCDVCKQPINPMRYWKHIKKPSHIRLQEMQKEKAQG